MLELLDENILSAYKRGPLLNVRLEYFVLASDGEGEYTPFQGFGSGIAQPMFSLLVELMAVLPVSPQEIFCEIKDIHEFRGEFRIKRASIISPNGFLKLQASLDWSRRIPIVIGMAKEIALVNASCVHPNVILVTNDKTKGAVCLAGYHGHPAQVLDVAIRDKLVSTSSDNLRDTILSLPLRKKFPDGTEHSRVSGVTIPNEALCVSLGYSYSGAKPISAGDADPYVSAIISSVQRARSLIGESSTNVVLFAPSIHRQFYSFDSHFWNGIIRSIKSRKARVFLKDGVFRNKAYSGYSVHIENKSEIEDIFKDPAVSSLLAIRQIELRLVASAIAALAANGLQPAIRLPNSINFCASSLREVERHAMKDDARARRLLQRSYINLESDLTRSISPRILEEIRSHSEAITVVSDVPVEWIRIDGIPLMIRHETSRIGMTPGNLMLQQCINSGMSIIGAEQLEEVLVLRSFAHNDPIKFSLETAIKSFELERLKVKFVDVDDRASLICELKQYDGMLVIFDCHGDHGGGDSHGWLTIGNERVDPWDLAGETRIPPIVILSACSTFALAGSHASVSNGLIRSGAITVLGTFLPVNAALSAIFVARLLYRIEAFLPALKALGMNIVTWRTLVSTFFRMSYASDLLHFFIYDKKWIDISKHEELGVQANSEINQMEPRWHEFFLNRLADASGRNTSDIKEVVEKECPLQETMYYCQVGRPEAIGIYLDGVDELKRINDMHV
ncbi:MULTISPECIES: hypothetical protein [unclassified Xanthomonas]|uniref:hypothetical protein n=1 Tax=Xanthomonas sp. LMG 8992 TaxID=1591157 RepID=UPI001368CCBA|nr:hypothetical protein [Xanthomonas sp. LMG 8992]